VDESSLNQLYRKMWQLDRVRTELLKKPVSRIDLYNIIEITFNRFSIFFNTGVPTLSSGAERKRGRHQLLTKQGLMKIRTRALRKGVWFKALSRIERSILDLTIRCVERIRSEALMKTVVTILDKLLETLEEEYLKRVERIGREIAEKISEIAWRWGNPHALTWEYDLRFVKFLGVNATNI